MVPIVRLQFGESGSVTVTLVSSTSPVFVTVILNVAVPPRVITCVFGSFTIEIAGWVTGGGGGPTVTAAESLADTSGPTAGVPVATATFVKLVITLATVHE